MHEISFPWSTTFLSAEKLQLSQGHKCTPEDIYFSKSVLNAREEIPNRINLPSAILQEALWLSQSVPESKEWSSSGPWEHELPLLRLASSPGQDLRDWIKHAQFSGHGMTVVVLVNENHWEAARFWNGRELTAVSSAYRGLRDAMAARTCPVFRVSPLWAGGSVDSCFLHGLDKLVSRSAAWKMKRDQGSAILRIAIFFFFLQKPLLQNFTFLCPQRHATVNLICLHLN